MNIIPWWYTKLDNAEKTKILASFDSGYFSLGPITNELEKRISSNLNVPFVVVTNSGTSAITMALLSLGVGPGDEVIIPNLTWVATAQAAAILGAKIVLIDCLPDSPLMDIGQVKRSITRNTKVIIPVHLNGREVSIDELKKITKDENIFIVEDCCKAFNSKSDDGYLGTLGDLGCYSMGMISLVSTGYGGFVATNDKKIYERLKLIRDHGVVRGGKEKYERIGFNFKISDVLSSMGVAQISRLKDKIGHLLKVYIRYVEGLSMVEHLDIIPVDIDSGKVPLCVDVRSVYREKIIDYLCKNNVETSRFHLPLNRASYLDCKKYFKNSERFSREGFMLPCGPSQPMENVDRCIELLQAWKPE